MKLSVVIPVYNEVATFEKILTKVDEACKKVQDTITDYEIVIVEDYSTDGTRELLKKGEFLKENHRVFFQNTNCGKGAAITRGFQETVGDLVLIQDADLEYDPDEYPVLLSPLLEKHADVVYGSRFKGGEVSRVLYFWHYLGNTFLTLFSNMFTNLNLTDMETCYKVFKGDLIRNMILTSQRFGIEPEMTAKIAKVPGIRIYEVPISYYGRTYEEGKKIGWKDGFSALYCILKYNIFWDLKSSFKTKP